LVFFDQKGPAAALLLLPPSRCHHNAPKTGLDTTSQLGLFWPAGQLIFGQFQFPRKAVPGMHIPQRKRKTAKAKGKSVSCAIAHTGLDYSVVNMGSAIFFSPNTHQQQHLATPLNAFRHTSSDAQNTTFCFSSSPAKLCRGTYANQLHSDVSWN
jgi:hypothetical protein